MAPARLLLFVNRAGYEAAWQASSLALTAAAMGEQVLLVFAWDALRALAGRRFGEPEGEVEREERERADALGVPPPARMLEEARALGARLVACDTTVRLCGLAPDALAREGVLDEAMGLASLWRCAEGARVVTL